MHTFRIRLIAVLFMLAALSAFAVASDWPQLRGPNRDGISGETGLLKAWPQDGPKLLWRMGGLGQAFSSLAIVGGRIYTMGFQGDVDYVMAIDAATQKVLWSTPTGKVYREEHGDGSRCTPTVDGALVYALSGVGDLVCLDTATGKELWRKNMSQDFGARMPHWGWAESPLVDGDHIVVTPGSASACVVALDKKTGAVVWKAALPDGTLKKDGAGYASLAVSNGGGVRQYIAFLAAGVVSVAAKDGTFLWASEHPANSTANCSMPVVSGDYVFISSAYNSGSVLLKLSPANGGVKVDEVYFDRTFQNHHGGVVLLGDCLYGGHGSNAGLPVCLDFKTGTDRWRAPEPSVKGSSAAITAADGMLFFWYDKGLVAVVAAQPNEYKVLCTFATPEKTTSSWAYPVISDGRLYIRDHDNLFCYDIRQ